jgi:pimeloyl-ACP methyl ester carboxylesterase
VFGVVGGFETESLLVKVLRSGFDDPSKLSDDFAEEVYRTGLRDGYRRMEYSLFDHWKTWVEAQSLYPGLHVPVTLVYSEHDWSRAEDRARTRELLRGARLITIENAGHFASRERPDAIVQAVLETSER